MSQGSANAAKPNGSNAINEIFSHSFPKKPVHNRLLTAASLLQANIITRAYYRPNREPLGNDWLHRV